METKQLYGVLGSFILFCLLAGSCTKTSIDKDVTQNQSLFSISEAKAWLAKASNSNLTGRTTNQATIINPDWDHTVAKEDEKYQAIEIPVTFPSKFYLAPATEKTEYGSKNATKYLVLKNKKTGELTSVLMNVVSDKAITDRDFHYAEVPADFSGQVFYSTAETAAFINGWKYTNGKITATIATGRHIEAAQPNCQDIEMGVYSTTCYYSGGGSLQYCDAAVLIYVYTISTCTGTGGGGGASTPPTNSCEAESQAFLNAGQSVSGPTNVTTEYNTGTEWKVVYDWKIFSAGTWGLISYEKAILNKVYYPDNINRWEYTTFLHDKIATTGINIGGSRTFEDLGATINMTSTHQTAWERIDFSVTSSVVCPGITPLTTAWNSNHVFYAPN